VERRFGLSRQAYWLALPHGLILFLVYVAGFFGSTVVWRGFRTPVTPFRHRPRVATLSASWIQRIRDGLGLLSHREGN
jgi:hypothetical protein